MDARLEVMHSKRPDRPLLATGRDRAEGRREEKLRELGALLPAKLPAAYRRNQVRAFQADRDLRLAFRHKRGGIAAEGGQIFVSTPRLRRDNRARSVV